MRRKVRQHQRGEVMNPNRFRTEGVPRRQAIAAAFDITPGVTFGDPPFGHVPPHLVKSLFTTGRGIYALAHTWIVQLTRAPPPRAVTDFTNRTIPTPDFKWI